MKIPLVILTACSLALSAQKKEQKIIIPRENPGKPDEPDPDKPKPSGKNRREGLYSMPVAKPDARMPYSSLKGKKQDTTTYRILNATPPEKKKPSPGKPLE